MESMDDNVLATDVLVIGAGMAGLTLGARACQVGASVVLVDVAEHLGGSAAISGGFVYTAPTLEAFLDEDPGGSGERFLRLRSGFEAAFEWLDGLGISQGPYREGIKHFGIGRQIDVKQYLNRAITVIESHGGDILRRTRVERLVRDGDGTVIGAGVRSVDDDAQTGQIRARHTVLATGGFQADRQWRERYIDRAAGDVMVRSNVYSRGDGIALGQAAGGALTAHMDGYYGHLVPYPLPVFEEPDYVLLAQYHSEHALLLGKDGRRFCDESLGDHVDAQAVGHIGSALMLIDNRILREEVLRPYMSGPDGVDKLAEGARRGANYASADTVEAVARAASAWGYDADGIVDAVAQFNAECTTGLFSPLRKRFRVALVEPPFAALEVQSAITFTFGGLRTDADGGVVRADGSTIPGLYALGIDAGGLNHRGYTGGLIQGLVFGRQLAEHLAGQLTPTAC
jgi:succinate dehydrogenase/fumarate reductase flavoprotein subunit